MKYRIRKLFALTLALSMLLSLIPLYGAAMIDEFEGLETVEEIPFEFVLEPGDLPRELLREAVLAPQDLPSCIDPELAEARGHVNRLYLQEPDDRTVMFQNRDGSKTVYLFSHPVKGMSASTVSSFEISGTRLSFTFNNAITSRVGVTLSNFNIGYAEVAYIPGGVLTEDGVNITEDVRDWARGESTVSALAYNISGEAAAEYAASVAVPETDVAATAAAAPGITITPNDPAPLGGMTVMSISYSDLAGVMSFKSVSANNYLVLHPNNRSSLMMYPRPISPYSRWVVSYDSYFGYTLTNLYHPESKYIGFDEDGDFAIAPIDDLIEAFRVDIVSSSNNSVNVTISDGGFAIDSTASLYLNDPDDTSYPTSCQWTIYTKTDYAPVQSITTSRIRTVNAEEPFYEAYTTNPAEPTYSDINLHFASNNQVVPTDSDFDMDDLCAYVIAEPGMYQVYYKDVSSGVRSANFWLNVVQNVQGITPASSVRIEQKGVGFDLDYTVLPELANNYSISLYYASNDEEVDYEEDEYGEPDYYYIDTPGIYSVYYKDSVSGVTSENFTILVYEQEPFNSKYTYMIQPMNAIDQFLTMTVTADEETNNLSLSSIGYSKQGSSKVNNAEKWDNLSKTFTIRTDESNSDYYNISATLATNQYNDTDSIDASEYTSTYTRVTLDSEGITNSISCDLSNNNELTTKAKTDTTAELQVLKINDSYVIICGINENSEYVALKYVYNDVDEKYEVEAAVLNPAMEDFRWKITHVGVDIPCIRQTRDYVCGYATLLQVIMGAGLDIEVDQSFLTDPGDTEDDLDAKMKTVWKITKNMNGSAYQGSIHTYLHTLLHSESVTNTSSLDPVICKKDSSVSSTTDQVLYDKLIGSMRTGLAPWIFTKKAYSPYTASATGAHYIAIAGVYYSNDNNSNNDFVIISNCHYVNGVHGIYVIPYSDFRTACQYVNGVEQFLYYCESVNNGG